MDLGQLIGQESPIRFCDPSEADKWAKKQEELSTAQLGLNARISQLGLKEGKLPKPVHIMKTELIDKRLSRLGLRESERGAGDVDVDEPAVDYAAGCTQSDVRNLLNSWTNGAKAPSHTLQPNFRSKMVSSCPPLQPRPTRKAPQQSCSQLKMDHIDKRLSNLGLNGCSFGQQPDFQSDHSRVPVWMSQQSPRQQSPRQQSLGDCGMPTNSEQDCQSSKQELCRLQMHQQELGMRLKNAQDEVQQLNSLFSHSG